MLEMYGIFVIRSSRFSMKYMVYLQGISTGYIHSYILVRIVQSISGHSTIGI